MLPMILDVLLKSSWLNNQRLLLHRYFDDTMYVDDDTVDMREIFSPQWTQSK
jgi:hypothetical protein